MGLLSKIQNNSFSFIDNLKLKYSSKFANRCAGILDRQIQQMGLITPKDALDHKTIQAARHFFKKFPDPSVTTGKVKDCWNRFRAAKLGISVETLINNPTFDYFSTLVPLERYLAEYNDELAERDDGHIMIRHDDVLTPWDEVWKKVGPEVIAFENKLKVKKEAKSVADEIDKFHQEWYYGSSGVMVKDMFAWKVLEPFKKERASADGDHWYFEYCVCCSDEKLRMRGDHSWFCLVDKDGNNYSAGKYLKSKLDGNPIFPLKAKTSEIMSPDVSEFWPIKIHRLRVEITETQFNAVKKAVEDAKKNKTEKSGQQQDLMTFQTFKDNCQKFVNAMAAVAGLRLPTSYSVVRLMTRNSVQKFYDKLPLMARKVIRAIGAFFINLVLVILGNSVLDSSLKKYNIKYRPKIKRFRDLFDYKKLEFHPPYYAHKVFEKVKERWGTHPEEMYTIPANIDQLVKTIEI